MEIRSRNGAIAIVPGRPRLSGKLCYGPPFPWEVETKNNSITIVPGQTGMARLIRYFLILAILGALCWFYLYRNCVESVPHNTWGAWFVALVPTIALIVGSYLLKWQMKNELRMGPWFHFSRDDGRLQFPRVNRSVDRDQVIRWELIFGCWVRNDDGSATLFGDDISELQLVFQEEGRMYALPLIGGLGPRALNTTAAVISDITRVPLERIEESRNLRNPYHDTKTMETTNGTTLT